MSINDSQEEAEARAYGRALNFLGYRQRSVKEIRDRLARDKCPDDVIERVLQRLISEGLLNNAEFAANWVVGRTLSRPRGAGMLRQELRQKGIEREAIDAALPDAEQELENAMVAVTGKLRRWEALEPRERRAKVVEFLQRRGFNYSVANAVVKRLEEDDLPNIPSE